MPEGAVQSLDLRFAIPCFSCGYDLRGLQCDGCCPECGNGIDESIRRHLSRCDRHPPLSVGTRGWLLDLQVGATAAIVAILLQAVAAAAPDWLYRWRSPQRAWALGLICSAWVIGLYACWRFSTVDASDSKPLRRVCIAIRLAIAANLAIPLSFTLRYPIRHFHGVELLVFGWIVVALSIGPMTLLRVGLLCRRGGAARMQVVSIVLALGTFVWALIALFGCCCCGDISSLGLMMRLPIPTAGSTSFLREASQIIERWPPADMVGCIVIMIQPLGTLIVMSIFWMMLHRVRTEGHDLS